jgi:hypothetical protein
LSPDALSAASFRRSAIANNAIRHAKANDDVGKCL